MRERRVSERSEWIRIGGEKMIREFIEYRDGVVESFLGMLGRGSGGVQAMALGCIYSQCLVSRRRTLFYPNM